MTSESQNTSRWIAVQSSGPKLVQHTIGPRKSLVVNIHAPWTAGLLDALCID